MWNEHGTYSNANSGADGSPGKDWVHKAGSAAAYFVTTTPTKRPDASTAFTTSDTGRFWVNSTSRAVKVLSGTTFSPVSSYEQYKYLYGKTLIVSIGAWDWGIYSQKDKNIMFSTYPFLSGTTIKRVTTIVQSDGGNGWFKSPVPSPIFSSGGNFVAVNPYANRIYIQLNRPNNLVNNFRTASNRGWMVIEYV